MGRKVQITREQMLETGLQMLIRDGYTSITVSSLARELDCSTQPILWCFGSIEGYRQALRTYAVDYMQQYTDSGDTIEDYNRVGPAYIALAIDKPNLIRYLRSDEDDLQRRGGIGRIFDKEKSRKRCQLWVDTLGVTMEEAAEILQFAIIYTEGIVSLILSGVLPPDKEVARQMLFTACEAQIAHLMIKKQEGSIQHDA